MTASAEDIAEHGGPEHDEPERAGIDRDAIRRAATAAADAGDADGAVRCVQALLRLPASSANLARDHAFAIAVLRLAGDPESAWAVARGGLARLGLPIPDQLGAARLAIPLLRWRAVQWLRRDPSGEPAPPADPDPLTLLCDAAATLAFDQSARTAAFLALEGRRHAPAAARGTPFWLACDTFLCAMLGDFRRAARLGARAVDLLDAQKEPSASAAASLYRAVFWGLVWRRSHAELRPRCLEVRDLALAEGDRVQAAIAVRNWVMIGWRTAPSLQALATEIEQADDQLRQLADHDSQSIVVALAAAVASLRGPPRSLADWARSLPPGNTLLLMELANLHQDYAAGLQFAGREPLLRRQLSSHPRGADWRFHHAVARLKTGRSAPRGDLRYLRRAARLNPVDNGAKVAIIAALRAGGRAGAMSAWAAALDLAECGPSRLEAGLCAALAVDAARQAGREQMSGLFADRARATWRAWGATALLRPGGGAGESPRTERDLLAEAAHELRTPLQALRATLDLAGDDPGALDMASLRRGVANLAGLLDHLAVHGGGGGAGPRAPVDLPRLIESECAALRPLAARAGRRLDTACELPAPSLTRTDGAGVAQVLRNLVSNAVKYGGPRILVRLALEGPLVAIGVEDDGPGIGETDIAGLFAPGERGAHAGEPGGEGLGLAIARRIAERLGGALVAEPRRPHGVRFTLTLPHEGGEPP